MCLWAKHNVKQFYQLLYGMTDFTKEFEHSNAAQLKKKRDIKMISSHVDGKMYMCKKKMLEIPLLYSFKMYVKCDATILDCSVKICIAQCSGEMSVFSPFIHTRPELLISCKYPNSEDMQVVL